MVETFTNHTNTMNEEMLESIAEERGYDRGFTAGTKHAHDLLTQYAQGLKHKRQVMESEGWIKFDTDFHIQTGINLVEDLKQLIRTGHYDEHT